MKKFLLLFAIAWAISTSSSAHAQSTLALQEKCAEGAKVFILRLDSVASYDSHYSKKLDGCFLRAGVYLGSTSEDMKLPDGKIKTLKHPHTMQSLYNVFDGKMIGNFSLIGTEVQDCWIANTKCKTIDEFENLLKPYLEQ
jgi:hypothetical protein